MDESPLIGRIRHPIWRGVVGLAFCVPMVVVAASQAGWVAATAVGVVGCGYALGVTLHWDRYAAWQQRHPILSGLAFGPLYFVAFAATTSGPLRGALLVASAMTLFLAFVFPLVQWIRRRDELYLEHWRKVLYPDAGRSEDRRSTSNAPASEQPGR